MKKLVRMAFLVAALVMVFSLSTAKAARFWSSCYYGGSCFGVVRNVTYEECCSSQYQCPDGNWYPASQWDSTNIAGVWYC